MAILQDSHSSHGGGEGGGEARRSQSFFEKIFGEDFLGSAFSALLWKNYIVLYRYRVFGYWLFGGFVLSAICLVSFLFIGGVGWGWWGPWGYGPIPVRSYFSRKHVEQFVGPDGGGVKGRSGGEDYYSESVVIGESEGVEDDGEGVEDDGTNSDNLSFYSVEESDGVEDTRGGVEDTPKRTSSSSSSSFIEAKPTSKNTGRSTKTMSLYEENALAHRSGDFSNIVKRNGYGTVLVQGKDCDGGMAGMFSMAMSGSSPGGSSGSSSSNSTSNDGDEENKNNGAKCVTFSSTQMRGVVPVDSYWVGSIAGQKRIDSRDVEALRLLRGRDDNSREQKSFSSSFLEKSFLDSNSDSSSEIEIDSFLQIQSTHFSGGGTHSSSGVPRQEQKPTSRFDRLYYTNILSKTISKLSTSLTPRQKTGLHGLVAWIADYVIFRDDREEKISGGAQKGEGQKSLKEKLENLLKDTVFVGALVDGVAQSSSELYNHFGKTGESALKAALPKPAGGMGLMNMMGGPMGGPMMGGSMMGGPMMPGSMPPNEGLEELLAKGKGKGFEDLLEMAKGKGKGLEDLLGKGKGKGLEDILGKGKGKEHQPSSFVSLEAPSSSMGGTPRRTVSSMDDTRPARADPRTAGPRTSSKKSTLPNTHNSPPKITLKPNESLDSLHYSPKAYNQWYDNFPSSTSSWFLLILQHSRILSFIFIFITIYLAAWAPQRFITDDILAEKRRGLQKSLVAMGVSTQNYVAHWVVTGVVSSWYVPVALLMGMFVVGGPYIGGSGVTCDAPGLDPENSAEGIDWPFLVSSVGTTTSGSEGTGTGTGCPSSNRVSFFSLLFRAFILLLGTILFLVGISSLSYATAVAASLSKTVVETAEGTYSTALSARVRVWNLVLLAILLLDIDPLLPQVGEMAIITSVSGGGSGGDIGNGKGGTRGENLLYWEALAMQESVREIGKLFTGTSESNREAGSPSSFIENEKFVGDGDITAGVGDDGNHIFSSYNSPYNGTHGTQTTSFYQYQSRAQEVEQGMGTSSMESMGSISMGFNVGRFIEELNKYYQPRVYGDMDPENMIMWPETGREKSSERYLCILVQETQLTDDMKLRRKRFIEQYGSIKLENIDPLAARYRVFDDHICGDVDISGARNTFRPEFHFPGRNVAYPVKSRPAVKGEVGVPYMVGEPVGTPRKKAGNALVLDAWENWVREGVLEMASTTGGSTSEALKDVKARLELCIKEAKGRAEKTKDRMMEDKSKGGTKDKDVDHHRCDFAFPFKRLLEYPAPNVGRGGDSGSSDGGSPGSKEGGSSSSGGSSKSGGPNGQERKGSRLYFDLVSVRLGGFASGGDGVPLSSPSGGGGESSISIPVRHPLTGDYNDPNLHSSHSNDNPIYTLHYNDPNSDLHLKIKRASRWPLITSILTDDIESFVDRWEDMQDTTEKIPSLALRVGVFTSKLTQKSFTGLFHLLGVYELTSYRMVLQMVGDVFFGSISEEVMGTIRDGLTKFFGEVGDTGDSDREWFSAMIFSDDDATSALTTYILDRAMGSTANAIGTTQNENQEPSSSPSPMAAGSPILGLNVLPTIRGWLSGIKGSDGGMDAGRFFTPILSRAISAKGRPDKRQTDSEGTTNSGGKGTGTTSTNGTTNSAVPKKYEQLFVKKSISYLAPDQKYARYVSSVFEAFSRPDTRKSGLIELAMGQKHPLFDLLKRIADGTSAMRNPNEMDSQILLTQVMGSGLHPLLDLFGLMMSFAEGPEVGEDGMPLIEGGMMEGSEDGTVPQGSGFLEIGADADADPNGSLFGTQYGTTTNDNNVPLSSRLFSPSQHADLMYMTKKVNSFLEFVEMGKKMLGLQNDGVEHFEQLKLLSEKQKDEAAKKAKSSFLESFSSSLPKRENEPPSSQQREKEAKQAKQVQARKLLHVITSLLHHAFEPFYISNRKITFGTLDQRLLALLTMLPSPAILMLLKFTRDLLFVDNNWLAVLQQLDRLKLPIFGLDEKIGTVMKLWKAWVRGHPREQIMTEGKRETPLDINAELATFGPRPISSLQSAIARGMKKADEIVYSKAGKSGGRVGNINAFQSHPFSSQPLLESGARVLLTGLDQWDVDLGKGGKKLGIYSEELQKADSQGKYTTCAEVACKAGEKVRWRRRLALDFDTTGIDDDDNGVEGKLLFPQGRAVYRGEIQLQANGGKESSKDGKESSKTHTSPNDDKVGSSSMLEMLTTGSSSSGSKPTNKNTNNNLRNTGQVEFRGLPSDAFITSPPLSWSFFGTSSWLAVLRIILNPSAGLYYLIALFGGRDFSSLKGLILVESIGLRLGLSTPSAPSANPFFWVQILIGLVFSCLFYLLLATFVERRFGNLGVQSSTLRFAELGGGERERIFNVDRRKETLLESGEVEGGKGMMNPYIEVDGEGDADNKSSIMATSIVSTKSLRLFYSETHGASSESGDNLVRAVDGVDLQFRPGEIFCLLGHNGAGKSTTVAALSCLQQPTSGSVSIFGHDSVTDPNAARRGLGLCMQDDLLWSTMTVRQHLEFVGRLRGEKTRGRQQKGRLGGPISGGNGGGNSGGRVENNGGMDNSSGRGGGEGGGGASNTNPHDSNTQQQHLTRLIEDAELEPHLDKLTSQLSGGWKRILGAASAFVGQDAKFIILDEPTTGVDPANRRKIWSLMERRRRDANAVILFTTHYMDEAEQLADRVGIMCEGKLLACGKLGFLKHAFGVGYAIVVKFPKGTISPQQVQNPKVEKILSILRRHTGASSDTANAEFLNDTDVRFQFADPKDSGGAMSDLLDEVSRYLEGGHPDGGGGDREGMLAFNRSREGQEGMLLFDRDLEGTPTAMLRASCLEDIFCRIAEGDFKHSRQESESAIGPDAEGLSSPEDNENATRSQIDGDMESEALSETSFRKYSEKSHERKVMPEDANIAATDETALLMMDGERKDGSGGGNGSGGGHQSGNGRNGNHSSQSSSSPNIMPQLQALLIYRFYDTYASLFSFFGLCLGPTLSILKYLGSPLGLFMLFTALKNFGFNFGLQFVLSTPMSEAPMPAFLIEPRLSGMNVEVFFSLNHDCRVYRGMDRQGAINESFMQTVSVMATGIGSLMNLIPEFKKVFEPLFAFFALNEGIPLMEKKTEIKNPESGNMVGNLLQSLIHLTPLVDEAFNLYLIFIGGSAFVAILMKLQAFIGDILHTQSETEIVGGFRDHIFVNGCASSVHYVTLLIWFVIGVVPGSLCLFVIVSNVVWSLHASLAAVIPLCWHYLTVFAPLLVAFAVYTLCLEYAGTAYTGVGTGGSLFGSGGQGGGNRRKNCCMFLFPISGFSIKTFILSRRR